MSKSEKSKCSRLLCHNQSTFLSSNILASLITSMDHTLDEESFLLGVNDIPSERVTNNYISCRGTVGVIAVLTSVVVAGTIALRFDQTHAVTATSLWSFPALYDILDSSKLVGNLMPNIMKEVKVTPRREMKKASSQPRAHGRPQRAATPRALLHPGLLTQRLAAIGKPDSTLAWMRL